MAISKNVLNSIKNSKKVSGLITYAELNDFNDKNTPLDPKNEIYDIFKNAIRNQKALEDVQEILELLWNDGGKVSVLDNKQLVYVSKDGKKTETIDIGFDNNRNIIIKRNGKVVVKLGTVEKVNKNVAWNEEKQSIINSINRMRSHKEFIDFLNNYLKGVEI